MKIRSLIQLSALLALLCVADCSTKKEPQLETWKTDTTKFVTSSSFGTNPDGKEVFKYTLTNKNGIEMTVINYGAIVVSLKTPDRNGNLGDIVLGYDSLSSYIKSNPF